MSYTSAYWVARNDLHWKYSGPIKRGISRAFRTSYRVPAITPAAIAAGLEKLDGILEELRGDEHIAHWLNAIRDLQNTYLPDGQRMVWVFSAGRSGTYALNRLLDKTGLIYPVQRLDIDPHFTRPEARTELFYRILLGRFDMHFMKRWILKYLVARAAIIADACRERKHFCYTVRSDREHALIIARLFPESRFIYLHQDPFKTFMSFYEKVRRIEEIAPLYLDTRLPEREFRGIRAFWGRAPEIAWNLYLARTFVRAAFDRIGDERCLDIKSEELFDGTPGTYDAINNLLPIDGISLDEYRAHFTVPANARQPIYPASPRGRARLAARYERMTRILEEKGAF